MSKLLKGYQQATKRKQKPQLPLCDISHLSSMDHDLGQDNETKVDERVGNLQVQEERGNGMHFPGVQDCQNLRTGRYWSVCIMPSAM